MRVTVDNTLKDQFHSIELEGDATVEDLKVMIEVEAQVTIDDQLLMFQNSFLEDNTVKLKSLGIMNDDIGRFITLLVTYLHSVTPF
jgi:hypothetical protein